MTALNAIFCKYVYIVAHRTLLVFKRKNKTHFTIQEMHRLCQFYSFVPLLKTYIYLQTFEVNACFARKYA